MIKANELRQGNLALFSYLHNRESKTRVVTVMEIMEKQCITNDNGKPLTLFYKDVSPIPLTPDWLERAGFVKHSNSNEFWTFWQLKNGWAISESHHNEQSAGVVLGHFYFSDEYIDMRNVHWLQNFYYFSTGEELIFNPAAADKTREGE